MRRRIPYLHHNHGFSLIEVLVTLVLLGVGLLGAQQMHANALRQHRESQQQARADQLAAALAERLRGGTPRVRLVFSGGGPLRAEWERQWGGLFEFMPPVPEEACAAHLLAADVHLVSQQPEWTGVVVPSKFQAACALARPVIFAGPPQSAVGTWLAAADAGWLLPPGDASALGTVVTGIREAAVRAGKGGRAHALFQRQFTKAANCGRLAALVETLAKNNP